MNAVVETYKLSVEEYKQFKRDGFLIVRGLVDRTDVAELLAHTEDLMYGRYKLDELPPPSPSATERELEQRLLRIHMLHTKIPLWEQFMLHPRVLDVVAALTGPDVLAMQTMLFIKAPGANGQGFHQDTYYIPTFPDSLLGAWIALDRADTENGCMWMCRGSHVEPIYPPSHGDGYGDWDLSDIPKVSGVGGHSNDDENTGNGLRPIAARYEEAPVVLDPGDVAFFGGHILHRSLSNKTPDRMRRAFVSHYCNARSYTPWDGGNCNHILARGNTTLAFRQPRFGTPCAALDPQPSISDTGTVPTMMMATPSGDMAAQRPSMEDHED